MEILFEDENLIAFLKPEGLLMHEGDRKDEQETFQSKLFLLYPEQEKIVNPYALRDRTINLGGIAHRLDRDTSGIVLVAKNEATLAQLKEYFTNGQVQKEYTALVQGTVSAPFIIESALGREKKGFKRLPEGDPNARGPFFSAKTEVTPLETLENNRTLVKLIPHTGRTHQLRAHLSFSGHPIVGDILYGTEEDKKKQRLYLHASKIILPDARIIESLPTF